MSYNVEIISFPAYVGYQNITSGYQSSTLNHQGVRHIVGLVGSCTDLQQSAPGSSLR